MRMHASACQRLGEQTESEKPTSEEYAVAKWLKRTKAVDALLTSKWATGKNPIFTTRQDVTNFLHQMLLHKLFHRAKKVPVSEQELKGKSKKKELEKASKSGDEREAEKSQASACEGKDSKEKEKEKKKRKVRLDMHMEQIFLDTADAYVWIYDPMPWYYWLCGTLVVLGTIMVCMFPLWPATV
ncbi:Translocation protein SEC62, partial [Eumeta japonica]